MARVYLNDSKATNIDAMEKALIAMRAPVVLLAGGKDKGLDFTGLRALLREKVTRHRAHRPDDGQDFRPRGNSAVPCHQMRSAWPRRWTQARLLAHRGDTVLFSPGCSSYDMFKSYEDRGDQFRVLVHGLTRQS